MVRAVGHLLGQTLVLEDRHVRSHTHRALFRPIHVLLLRRTTRRGQRHHRRRRSHNGSLIRLKFWSQPQPKVLNEIKVAAPGMYSWSWAADLGHGGSIEDTTAKRISIDLPALLLHASISYKGAKHDGVGDGSSGENLDAGEEGTELLISVAVDGFADAV